MNYGQKIKSARIKKNLTQKELADLIGVSNNLICKWESNDRIPKAKMLEKLVEILNVDSRYFTTIKEELIPLLVFNTIEDGKLVFEYDVWNDRPVYKNVLADLINNEIFQENVTQLMQKEIDEKYFIYIGIDKKTHIVKRDFNKIIDGRLYAIIDDGELLLGQLFNYKNEEFFAIIIDYNKIIKQVVNNTNKGEEINNLKNDVIIRKFFSPDEKNKIVGIVISTIIGLD